MTIALLAHLAGERGEWGPHLIIVPTSVLVNWEMEFKRWLPGFKIVCYYGNAKERKLKRSGWNTANAVHVVITSYKLAVADQHVFRRRQWHYLILDEAQYIKNFRSQRWQTLINLKTKRRLLLSGTPLQNSLMELWSLMHFLMPRMFASQKEFQEWFSDPVNQMLDGSIELSESEQQRIIPRLHKVLRPFLLRRLKKDVAEQLPEKHEHVIACRLSRRQRRLYEDVLASSDAKRSMNSGNYLSLMNLLMQLRKVCNHPDLFAGRPVRSPFFMQPIRLRVPALLTHALDHDPFRHSSPQLIAFISFLHYSKV
jgi:SNF2 family DNA or RNA helicase